MSHFAVLVIGPDPEKQLQPYHEYECTGIEDEYVIDVDVTDEITEEYNTRTVTRWVDSKGDRHCPYEDRFYREPTPEEIKKNGSFMGRGWGNGISWNCKDWGDGRGYRGKVHMTAEEAGMTAIEVPKKDLETLEEFAKDWGGYFKRDGRFYNHTNPNRKWDWYVLGGRWKGMLTLKTGKEADHALMKEVDWKSMRNEAEEKARTKHRQARAFLGDLPEPTPWSHFMALAESKEIDWDKARELYHAQPACQKLREIKPRENPTLDWLFWAESDELQNLYKSEDWYADRARRRAVTTFAVVKDGKWYERGSMGWWGCVSDEKDENEWINQYNQLVESLSPDTLISVYDCHI